MWRRLRRSAAALLGALLLCAGPALAQDGGSEQDASAGQKQPESSQQPGAPAEAGAAPQQPETPFEGPPIPMRAPEPELPTVKELETRIAELEQMDTRSAAQEAVLEHLRSARDALQRAAQSSARAKAFEQDAAAAPARLESIRAELARTTEVTLPPELRDAPVAQVESQLRDARTQLEVDRRQRTGVDEDEQRRAERRQVIPNELARLRAQLEEINDALTAPAPAEEDSTVTAARRLALQAEREALTQQINALEKEIRSYDARRELLDARRKQANERIRQSEARVNKLETLLNQKRAAAAEVARREAEQASREAQTQHPVLQNIAEKDTELAAEREKITARTIEETTEKRVLQQELDRLRSNREELKQQAALGLNEAIGLRLRTMRSKLPSMRDLQRDIRERRSEVNRVQFRQQELIDLQTSLQISRQEEAQRLLDSAGVTPQSEQYDALLEQTSDALAKQSAQYLDPLIDAYQALTGVLVSQNTIQNQKRELVEQFRSFIDERILWVQSAQPISVEHLRQSWDALQWLVSPSRWSGLAQGLWQDVQSHLALIAFALVVIGVIRSMRRRYVRLLHETGQAARSMFKAKFGHTLAAAGLTVLICLPTPLVVLLLAWRVEKVAQDVEFAGAIAPALRDLAAPLFVVLFLWHLCRPGGLAEAHFRWRKPSLRLTRKLLRIAAPIGLPLLFVMRTLDSQSVVAHNNSLGRFVFIALMALMSYVVWRLLSPKHGIIRQRLVEHPNGWLARLRYVWFPALVLVPAALAIVAAVGYFYTAVQLEQRVIYTVRLIVVLAVAHALLQRWLYLAQRRVAIEQATKAQTDARTADTTADLPPLDPQTIDVAAMSSQTMKLLRTMMFFAVLIGVLAIWSDVFPAFGMLREVTLWSDGPAAATTSTDTGGTLDTLTTGDGTAGPNGAEGGAAQPAAEPAAGTAAASDSAQRGARITLADLIYALFILAITVIISRDVPGLLEFAVLQRLPITYGARYAISTVTRYALVIIGVVLAFDAIGIGWSKVQFLAAAITVGLGFGLQEIFANFVSGLIILFERPIRIGDTVTVGNISGTVSRIRMRATTITDWDRKELIIPNKEFVTGQIVNWTLSDAILRVIVPVGIAYGSDTAKAKEILLRVAEENEIVLDDPPPRALFLGFGDSSLNFDVRVFIPSIEYFLQTRDALHEAIDREFRKAGVEIAFPQRDLHLRSVAPQILAQSQGRVLDKPAE